MTFPSKLAMTLLLLALSTPVSANPFVNLNFEQATVPPGTGSTISTSLAFPGWTARVGTLTLSQVYYNNQGLDERIVALYDMPGPFAEVIQGNYDTYLRTEFGSLARTSLSQTGDIPVGTQSLRLLAEFGGPPSVTVDGIAVPMTLIPGSEVFDGFGIYATFAGDISSFAGITAELRFTSPLLPMRLASQFDAISFSPEPIPEPSTVILMASWGLFCCIKRQR